MIELRIAVEVPFLGGAFDVVLNLLSSRVEMAPIRLGIKWECLVVSSISRPRHRGNNTNVNVSRHIALYAGVSIDEPSASDIRACFQYLMLDKILELGVLVL